MYTSVTPFNRMVLPMHLIHGNKPSITSVKGHPKVAVLLRVQEHPQTSTTGVAAVHQVWFEA